MNLGCSVLGMKTANPTVLASGMMGITSSGWKRVAEHGAGVVTTKSMWATEHPGNPNPVVMSTESWTLNAVGVPYAGKEVAVAEVTDYVADRPAPLIANVIGMTPDEIHEIMLALVPLKPDAFELNLSTPTFLKLRGKFLAEDKDEAVAIIRAAKEVAGDIPVLCKLTPNVPSIADTAVFCVEAGADGLTAINTVGPGMAIDLRSRMPILSARKGGLSGRAVKPIAVRCIADIYAATEGKVPIIGLGGIYTGEDAIELMLAGASLVGIGTAIWERGLEVFGDVTKEMQDWCKEEGVQNVSELTGAMHKTLVSQGAPYS